MAHRFDPSILREYDVRGVVGRTLGPADAHAIGRCFATRVLRAGGTRVAVGRDGRTSSPALETALVAGLTGAGVDVVRIGMGPTPMLYYAEAVLEVDGGIQVTGSHNPADHNGFKMVLRHAPLFGADIRALGAMALAGDWSEGAGHVAELDLTDRYVERLMAGYAGGAFRIGWDAGNGAAGPALERLTAALPGEHHLLHTTVDGRFPHHHPDPSEPANLADLQALVAAHGLDLGVAFDGDADRIGVIDGDGRIVQPDQLLAILAEPVLLAEPGATIITDVKASGTLFDRVRALGGVPLMGRTGHSPIKALMRETGAPLAGDSSGHIFFARGWYGFDDALYAAVRLIAAVHQGGGSLAAMRAALPVLPVTPELRIACADDRKFAVIEAVLARLATDDATVDRTDGARVTTPDGWWLLRASNTQPMLTARAEARDEAGLDRLLDAVDAQLAPAGIAPLPRGG